MMQFKIDENEMISENKDYVAEMFITGKGQGHDGRQPRLRCAVIIKL
ncbi:hypothetical protein ACSFXN_03880 [Planococcus sp. 1R117A]